MVGAEALRGGGFKCRNVVMSILCLLSMDSSCRVLTNPALRCSRIRSSKLQHQCSLGCLWDVL